MYSIYYIHYKYNSVLLSLVAHIQIFLEELKKMVILYYRGVNVIYIRVHNKDTYNIFIFDGFYYKILYLLHVLLSKYIICRHFYIIHFSLYDF